MATSKRSASPSPTGKPPFTFTATALGGKPLQPLALPAGKSLPTTPSTPQLTTQPTTPSTPPPTAAISLSTLLMVGADRVIIDAAEDDDLQFMAEYIDLA